MAVADSSPTTRVAADADADVDADAEDAGAGDPCTLTHIYEIVQASSRKTRDEEGKIILAVIPIKIFTLNADYNLGPSRPCPPPHHATQPHHATPVPIRSDPITTTHTPRTRQAANVGGVVATRDRVRMELPTPCPPQLTAPTAPALTLVPPISLRPTGTTIDGVNVVVVVAVVCTGRTVVRLTSRAVGGGDDGARISARSETDVAD
jgi:hypothetical protein